ncbi:hypothetical protein BC628DRAFT_1418674 [Trametes gibbosa]|nr:hypothetical protein BC628DRAFT_1418674 [Trametes gibbosa]
MAHVMKPPVGKVPGPYADNHYIPTTTHGWVHANTWFASVPFNSAPPPAPAGVNPQTWANGRWQQNPYFRAPPNMTQPQNNFQMWAPHPGWGSGVAAAAGAQNWNPYKRIPNPGDASYWATELSDNPLKLENMHIKDDTPAEERHRKDSSNGVPHTPWVWVPKQLSNDSSKSTEGASTSGTRDGQGGQRQQQQSEKDLPPPPQVPRLEYIYEHTRTNSSSRNMYAPPPTAQESSSQSRHYAYDTSRSASTAQSQDRAPSSAPPTVSTYSAYHQRQQQQESQPADRYPTSSQQSSDAGRRHQSQQSHDHDSQPYSSRDYRNTTTSSGLSSASAAAAAASAAMYTNGGTSAPTGSLLSEREAGRDESYSARRELLPTFSPKIVRTPNHYHTTPARISNRDDIEHTPRHGATTPNHGPIYAPATTPTRTNSLNAGRQSTQPPSSAASSNSSLGLLNLTEEPDSVLSPLIGSSTPPDSPRRSPRNELSRSQTFPAVAFDYVPEERERPVYRKTPRDYPRSISREPSDRQREYDRSRDADATPQPETRTPPAHTPPLSHYTRPSPESRAGSQKISRSLTYPAVIPPPPITPQRSRSPGRSPRYSPSQPQSQSYSSPYGQSSSATYARTSPNPPTSSVTSAASPLRHNPLPRPPQASAYAEQLTRGSSSASAAAAAAQQQQQQQQNAHRRQVRHGFWNRRGDHLFVNDRQERYIVYAPQHLANPEDLKHYPSPTDGWQDHLGNFMKYDPGVPELRDSLPVHGLPATRPYKNFVQYVTV